jgi:hypothetical protein
LKIPALAAALLAFLSCPAHAQETPEAVYAKYHQALRAGNVDEVKKYAIAANAAKMRPIPAGERDAALALIRALLPQSYTVTGKEPGADGKSLTLRANGMGTNFFSEKPESTNGVITMLKEGNDWKVDKPEWTSADQRGVTPEQSGKPSATLRIVPQSAPRKPQAAAVASKQPEPAPVMRATRPPCVYKAVMSNEDIERCR